MTPWNQSGVVAAHSSPAARSATNVRPPARTTVLDRLALGWIHAAMQTAPLRLSLWDGFSLSPAATPPVVSIEFRSRRALAGCLLDPESYFGECYMDGEIDVHGDLVTGLEGVYRALGAARREPWWRRHRANDRHAARENVHRHYDLGNDFYRLWLDDEMVYTCAYFPTPEATLEEAQLAKLDLVCRKLRLQHGERIVEAGCGWGALALHMARRYGVRVRGFNVSSEQVGFARTRAAREGLDHLVEFVDDDYRNVCGRYDAFVSVGMLEHVGQSDYGVLGDVIARVLAPRGRGLLHFIGRNRPGRLNPWIRRRIFPGAYAPALREVFEHVLEPHDFAVLDVENLRRHYALTLRHWRARFEEAADPIRQTFDDRFVRAWRLYLAGSEAAFDTGSLQLFQVVFASRDSTGVPWTRGA